jgi:hypothetical protein
MAGAALHDPGRCRRDAHRDIGRGGALTASGAVDTPAAEAVVDTTLHVAGWALDADGIRSVEIRIDGRLYEARYGIARPDVAAAKPGFPNSAAAGFEFGGDFSDLDPVRHSVSIVAINRLGRETILGTRSLIPPQAMSLWRSLLDDHPALAALRFRFLMMTSGVSAGGASEIESTYQSYYSATNAVGTDVPILYLRTTKGVSGDWQFDPDFDLTRKCKDRPVAEDNLHGVIQYAIDKRLPVQFILNGGIWADASCDTPEWDVKDHARIGVVVRARGRTRSFRRLSEESAGIDQFTELARVAHLQRLCRQGSRVQRRNSMPLPASLRTSPRAPGIFSSASALTPIRT